MNDPLNPLVSPLADTFDSGGTEGRVEWTCPDGLGKIVYDTEQFDFHIDIAPDGMAGTAESLLARVCLDGFEPLSEEECEPELLDTGWVRIYLAPVVPVDDTPLARETA